MKHDKVTKADDRLHRAYFVGWLISLATFLVWLVWLVVLGVGCIRIVFDPLPVQLSWAGVTKSGAIAPDAGELLTTSPDSPPTSP